MLSFYNWFILFRGGTASFPDVEEGAEKEHLVHTVVHALNFVVTVFLHVCMYTDDIMNSLR